MPNNRVIFITNAGGNHGSSLYMVTAHWVLRCSGNRDPDNGRVPETFIRRRSIVYTSKVRGPGSIHTRRIESPDPTVGSTPEEGRHTGHPISEVVSVGANLVFPANAPATWNAVNGVAWTTAVSEVDAAAAFARDYQYERASREVGQARFYRD
jgi:hypothetical protein